MGAACSGESATQTKGNSHQPAAARKDESAAHYFETIRDKFETVEEVQSELRKAGLESSELIVAIDLTKSNEWSGNKSFNGCAQAVTACAGQCLHSLASGMNPYKSVISIIAKTLSAFDDDQLIPTYGFGDVQSREKALVNFSPSSKPLQGLDNVVSAYDSQVGGVQLSGPTSFAPAVLKAIQHVRDSGGRYHILLIIADGQVQVSEGACMKQTVDAIVEASNYPLSIIMVGVGDGPFDKMRDFDDLLTQRLFDNFQFVDYTDLGQRAAQRQYNAQKWEADFALASLMEIPDQYRLIGKLGLLGKTHFARPASSVTVTPLAASTSNGGQQPAVPAIRPQV